MFIAQEPNRKNHCGKILVAKIPATKDQNKINSNPISNRLRSMSRSPYWRDRSGTFDRRARLITELAYQMLPV